MAGFGAWLLQAEQVWRPGAGVVADREIGVGRVGLAERRAGAQDELLVVAGAAEDLYFEVAGFGVWLLQAEQVWRPGAGVVADREIGVGRVGLAERRAGAQDELLVVAGAAEDLYFDVAGFGVWLLQAEQVWRPGAGVVADREIGVGRVGLAERRAGAQDDLLVVAGAAEDLYFERGRFRCLASSGRTGLAARCRCSRRSRNRSWPCRPG